MDLDVLFPGAVAANGKGSGQGVVHSDVTSVPESLPTEAALQTEPKLWDSNDDVLVEEEYHEVSQSQSVPPPVHKQKSPQKSELTYGVV